MKGRILADFESTATVNAINSAIVLPGEDAFHGERYVRMSLAASGTESARSGGVREVYSSTPRNIPACDGILIHLRALDAASADHMFRSVTGGPLKIVLYDPSLAASTYIGTTLASIRPGLWDPIYIPAVSFDTGRLPGQIVTTEVQIVALDPSPTIVVDVDGVFAVTWDRSATEE